MAIINCPECTAKISDKALSCPKCGAPVISFYSNNAEMDDSVTSNSTVNISATTPDFVKRNKRNLKWVFCVCALVAAGMVIFAIVMDNKVKNTPDPNRTEETCTLHGTCKVYPVPPHNCDSCIPDGDGYYDIIFGHHHHK